MRRTSAMMVAASSCVPCEKLSRTTLTPAKKSDRSIAGSRDAGPTVATIFVRFGGGCIGARRSPALLAVLRLDESSDGITSSRKRFAQRMERGSRAGKNRSHARRGPSDSGGTYRTAVAAPRHARARHLVRDPRAHGAAGGPLLERNRRRRAGRNDGDRRRDPRRDGPPALTATLAAPDAHRGPDAPATRRRAADPAAPHHPSDAAAGPPRARPHRPVGAAAAECAAHAPADLAADRAADAGADGRADRDRRGGH